MSMDVNNGGKIMNTYVECLSYNYVGLTNGKVYKLECEGPDYIKVLNNVGDLRAYPSNIFRKLTKQEEEKLGLNNDKIKPSYYGSGIDVIEFCLRNNLTFMQGNVIKYVTRYKKKNGIEDLEKAKEYIVRLIEFEKREDK